MSNTPSMLDEVVEVSESRPYTYDDVTYSDDSGTVLSDCDCGMPTCSTCGRTCSWYVEADALFLNRTRTRKIKLLEDDLDSTTPRGQRRPLLTTDAFDFDYEWGPRLIFGCCLDCNRRIEFVYYGLHHWDAPLSMTSNEAIGEGNMTFPIGDNIVDDYDGADFVSMNYASELHNFEANYIINRCGCIDPLIGFRYMNVNERFNYFTLDYETEPVDIDDYNTSSFRIDTDNHLVGFQLGGLIDRPIMDCLCLNFGATAGLYVNFANQSTWMGDDDNTEVLRDFNEEVGELAFIGDLKLGLTYQMTSCISATAGYQVMWVEGVALAPEQVSYESLPTSGKRVNHDGSLFYDGGYARLLGRL